MGCYWSFPDSSDLASSDYHLFCHLKHKLGKKHFDTDEAVKALVTTSKQASDFYDREVSKLGYKG